MRQTAYTPFYDQNEDRHSYQATYPEEYIFAHSRHTYVTVDQLRDAEGVLETGVPVRLFIQDTDADVGYTETKYVDSEGKVNFDVARFLQIFMDGTVEPDADFDYTEDSKMVARKTVHIEMHTFGVKFWEEDFDVVNGADEVTDCWWSEPRQLKWWPAYPFTFDYWNFDEASVTVNDGTAAVTRLPEVIPDPSSNSRIRINAAYFTGANSKLKVLSQYGKGFSLGSFDNQRNSVTLVAQPQPIAEKYVYLRWLNRHGELSYWLFNRHSVQRTPKASDSMRAYVKDERFNEFDTCDNALLRYMTVNKELQVFSDALDGFDYDVVRQLFTAPFVDMLIPERSLVNAPVWLRVHIKAEKHVEPLRHADDYTMNRQVTVTLTLPEEGQIFV